MIINNALGYERRVNSSHEEANRKKILLGRFLPIRYDGIVRRVSGSRLAQLLGLIFDVGC